MKPQLSRRLSAYVCATAITVASGCASTNNDPADPFEGFNRAMFAVNEGLDTVAIKPVAQGYDAVTPLPVKVGVGNFFGNIWDSWTAINNLLQGKGGDALSDVGRVLINSTIGIGGVFDVASEMGLTKHSEEFGQTLGKWGVPDGPYFYWPLIGPRTTRDTFGWMVDTYYDPVWRVDNIPLRNSLVAVRYVDLRASVLPTDKVIEEAAFDKYSYIRDAYLQHRRNEIFDGDPPRIPLDY
ncbi:MAG: putative phospholipid-binding lipoprotein MlaA precursor [Candidatus Accumulibacter regalis]|uniref:Phospholipid-binding lipoprotein MlaA n=1 Tax=Accumulibacter regalis TaxID=522306 RepID=A0A011Q7P3_ACCRE|nr:MULTISPECIES: VacJ family lipoprotein [unclassified Candidatus Accumulibacter]EXI85267.1 MAG: putative phospholipid-binding lipoprotein MlaA precursor [Candidatus Accumulibacter regalis]MQM33440.1 ABC transporter [Candidatus Accumulibacter phosphatis]MBL8366480.1 VacJ family lipoprotein [Accumulibacter sp.]MBN8514053.1 VacJ family lipoprotein [Accumulibacter sp.]MBO3702643.1 VacJ family lipoprotein [Accumulibacter sp.]